MTDPYSHQTTYIETENISSGVKPLAVLSQSQGLQAVRREVVYVRTLVANTPKEQLLNPEKTKQMSGLKPEDLARMENESGNVEQDYKIAKDSYNVDVYHLTLARAYVRKLLGNAKIVKFLAAKHADMLAEFQMLIALEAL